MRLNVLHIPQEKQNSCWHASARMLYGFKKSACIHPLPKTWTKDAGIGAGEFIDLAKAMGLRTLPKVKQSFSWKFLDESLGKYGPLWAAGQWNGVNHIVVITGVDVGGKVFVNDPAFPSPVERKLRPTIRSSRPFCLRFATAKRRLSLGVGGAADKAADLER